MEHIETQNSLNRLNQELENDLSTLSTNARALLEKQALEALQHAIKTEMLKSSAHKVYESEFSERERHAGFGHFDEFHMHGSMMRGMFGMDGGVSGGQRSKRESLDVSFESVSASFVANETRTYSHRSPSSSFSSTTVTIKLEDFEVKVERDKVVKSLLNEIKSRLEGLDAGSSH